MEKPKLGLIVLKTKEIGKMLEFYKATGLEWVEEKYGNGAIHYSTNLGELVLEIYPEQKLDKEEKEEAITKGNIMFAFTVDSLDKLLDSLHRIGVEPISPPKQSMWGRRLLVLDPDRRTIEFIEPSNP